MGQNLTKVIGNNANIDVINKLLRMLLQLDSVMCNAMFDLNNELKNGGVIRQEIKKNLNDIKKKLKTNIKGDWEKLDDGFTDNFIQNAERFEQMCYNFFRLGNGMSLLVQIDHPVGSKVWTMHNNKETLCLVKRIEVQMVINDNSGQLVDKSFYVLNALDKDGKETNEVLYCGENEIYKHRKDMRNENTKV